MDIPDNDSVSMDSQPPRDEAISPHAWVEECLSEPPEAGDRLHASSAVKHELARRLAYLSEVREAKIRELRDAIKDGTYDVPADQVAEKMLRDMLHSELP